MGALVASLEGTPHETNMSLSDISQYSAFWEQARLLYAPFECTTTMKSGNADVRNWSQNENTFLFFLIQKLPNLPSWDYYRFTSTRFRAVS